MCIEIVGDKEKEEVSLDTQIPGLSDSLATSHQPVAIAIKAGQVLNFSYMK